MARSDPIHSKLLASSGVIATIVFLILGLAFGGWGWAWVVFLLPGVVAIWFGEGDGKHQVERAPKASTADLPPGHEGDEQSGQLPPPQRYEG